MGVAIQSEKQWSTWMAEAQKGDRQCYSLLLKEISVVLKRFVYSRIHSPDLAEECVQDILLKIHSSRQSYHPNRPFGPWMFAIARHRIVDFYRKKGREEDLQEQNYFETLTDAQTYSLEEQLELREEVNRVLRSLPEKQRLAVLLLKFEGMSVKEVSAQLDLSESAVKVSAHRGYQVLKAYFGGESQASRRILPTRPQNENAWEPPFEESHSEETQP